MECARERECEVFRYGFSLLPQNKTACIYMYMYCTNQFIVAILGIYMYACGMCKVTQLG